MNTQIRRLGIGLLTCYLALFVMLNWVQVVHKDQLDNHPLNDLRVKERYNQPRGTISSADGTVLAQSVDITGSADFKRKREYPTGDLFAQTTGYYSFSRGSAGVERTYDRQLTGQTLTQQLKGFADIFDNQSSVGNLTLTLRKDLQQTARDSLGAKQGSVVALDPRTGAILAFWSFPSFDPNPISSTDAKAANLAWTLYNQDPTKPLLAHQYQERYFPGSTFKVVTASTGLQTGTVTLTNPSYPAARSYTPPHGKPIFNFGGEVCGGTLLRILEVSCNSAFAQMGTETIGPDKMIAGAQAFGFNQSPPIDLPDPAPSNFPTNFQFNLAGLAQSSIGQQDVAATPLQMALVAAAVADNGTIMKPHVMSVIRDSEGSVTQRYDPAAWVSPISAQTAAQMHDAMIQVVQHGTATVLKIPGFDVGAKTGTAQLGLAPPRSHTWMIAFAGPPGQPPTIAVSVVVLNQAGVGDATGAKIAGPIARDMLTAYLGVAPGAH